MTASYAYLEVGKIEYGEASTLSHFPMFILYLTLYAVF